MKKSASIITATVLASLLPLGAWACGESNHIGNVTAVDTRAKSFTIMDMATQKPLTFAASDKILLAVASTKQAITVNYREENGKLIALTIE